MTDQIDTGFGRVQLRCSEVVELVTEYLEGELRGQDLMKFEAHLDHCEACTVFVDQVKMTITLTSTTSRQVIELMPANFEDLVGELSQRVDDFRARSD